jgi:uncharacterized membrane protein
MEARPPEVITVPGSGLVTLTHVMYGMHAFSALMGMLGPMFIVTAFLTGWPSIIAIIINYVKRSDVRGTHLDSHFGWQLRTFWYAVLGAIVALLLVITLIGIPLAWMLVIVVGLWVLYRLIRGWMALLERKPMPVDDRMQKI